MEARPPPLAPYARLVLTLGFLVTVGTGAGLYVAPSSLGESFAWTIRVPLTAAFIGAGYLSGAAFALALALREGIWERVRIVVVPAFVLVTTSLVATIRFLDDFAIGKGSARQQFVAWTWLVIYVTFPPALLLVFLAQERAGRSTGWVIREPLTTFTRAAFASVGLVLAGLGLWITFSPERFGSHWPWKLPPVSAAVIGTWLLTLAATYGWALLERDWQRVRIVAVPLCGAILLHLVAAARYTEAFTGSTLAIVLYLLALALAFSAFAGASITQARARRDARQRIQTASA